MSGSYSQNKGKRGEREIAGILRDQGFENAMRTAQLQANSGHGADVIGVPGVHVEVKYQERLNVYAAFQQASQGALPGEAPMVCHRKSRHSWLATADLLVVLAWIKAANAPRAEGL